MKSFSKFLITVIALGCFALSGRAQDSQQPMTLQDAVNGLESVTNGHAGVPEDWSSHHLIFSQPVPGTATYDKVTHDPRYWMQQIRRLQSASVDAPNMPVKSTKNAKDPKAKIKKDWSYVLNSTSGPVATAGLEMYPAKFPFSTSAPTCSDYVVYNTSQAGSISSPVQPTIVAFDNLYATTCGATTPTVYFAYVSGGGSALTSPVISADGTKIAFVESTTTPSAIVRLIQFKSGDGSFSTSTHNWTAAAPTNSESSWTSCPAGASCMISVTLSGTTLGDTNSAAYVDYVDDILYVGDNDGRLHKITNVFGVTGATPTEAGSPWPVTVNSGEALSSPVYDSVSGNIFVGDASGRGSAVSSAGALNATHISLGANITDGPIVDSSTSKVYWFGNSSTSPLTDVVEQTSTAMGSAVTISLPNSGTTGRTGHMHSGAFDNIYLSSAGGTGHLYLCAVDSGASNHPALFNVAITSGVMAGVTLNGPLDLTDTTVSDQNECSPLTEFLNGSTDRLFGSVQDQDGTLTGCSTGTGCMYSFTITSAFPTNSSAGLLVPSTGGTSGIVIDNTGSGTGESQIYYSLNSSSTCGTSGGTGGCAVQAAQSGP